VGFSIHIIQAGKRLGEIGDLCQRLSQLVSGNAEIKFLMLNPVPPLFAVLLHVVAATPPTPDSHPTTNPFSGLALDALQYTLGSPTTARA
jgi:hypothetical protein